MKIAVFYYIEFSGAKRVVQEHVKGLRALGHLVDVYTTKNNKDIFDPSIFANNNYYYDFSQKDLRVPVLKRIKQDYYDTFFRLRELHKKIAREIDERKYDIVLVHTDINTQAPFILRYLKTKNVYFCLEPLRNAYEYSLRLRGDVSSANKFYENLNRWVRKKIDRENTLEADETLTISLFARERMIAAYDLYPRVSYLGVDEKIFRPKKIKKNNQILFLADRLPIYGYDLAMEAMNLIPKKTRPELKIISWKKNNNERISDEELVNLYNESIVTLSLSKFDTFGLVPLESMACGVPVIALNVAGYRETIKDNITGFLVDFDPKEIARKITFLMNNPAASDKMGDEGRDWILKKWRWKEQVTGLDNVLKEMVRKNG